MTKTSADDNQRRYERAERLFTEFEFGLQVKGSGGWTSDTIQTAEGLVLPVLKRTVFFEPEDGSSESLKGEFEVVFQGEGDLVAHFCANMPDGRILPRIGSLGVPELALLAAVTRQANKTASNEPTTILIVVEGGVIRVVVGVPPGVRVVVRDFDVDGSEENLIEHEDGRYVEGVYEGPVLD